MTQLANKRRLIISACLNPLPQALLMDQPHRSVAAAGDSVCGDKVAYYSLAGCYQLVVW